MFYYKVCELMGYKENGRFTLINLLEVAILSNIIFLYWFLTITISCYEEKILFFLMHNFSRRYNVLLGNRTVISNMNNNNKKHLEYRKFKTYLISDRTWKFQNTENYY